MSRISTFGASQSALADLMRTQRSLFEAQVQLTTGKKASDLKGVGHEAETLSAARSALAKASAYEEASVRAAARLDTQNVALERLADSTSELRVALTAADGTFLMDQVQDAFYQATDALRTTHSGGFVFGGTRTDVDPITVTDMSDLIPMASAAEAFQNSSRRPQVQLDQNILVDVGLLADDVGGDVMAAFKRIADYDAGPSGPFSSPMDANQQAFIRTELPQVIAALDKLHATVGRNGSAQARVDTLKDTHQDRQVFLAKLLGELEDVDMAEAATRFQQAQTALEVSAKTFSTLSQVSLLPFLR
jgi:flagellar hook-associated protein 3 FlgL